MSNIVEILGQKKFYGSENQNLKTRLILEQPGQVRNEYNLFTNVSQDEQYTKEKLASTLYNIYGTISPLIAKKASYKGFNINVDNKVLDFNPENWSMVLCKPIQFLGKFKGKKIYDYIYNDGTKHKLDFTYGLPASLTFNLGVLNRTDEYFSFYLHYNHNFSVGDRVYITSNDSRLNNGLYNIRTINGKKITIDEKIVPKKFYTANTQQAQNVNQLIPGVVATPLADPTVDTSNKYTGVIRNVQTKNVTAELLKELKDPRPKPFNILNTNFSIAKVIDNVVCEYYVKQAEVVLVSNDIDECAFSKNIFNEPLYNFYFKEPLNTQDLYDNNFQPMTECYLGIIKNGPTKSKVFTNVESNFSYLIDYTNPGEGIKTITFNSSTEIYDKPDVGNIYDIGLYEYSPEELTETLIMDVKHNFLLNDVLFTYTPFYEIPLKLKSTYVEDSVSKNFIPDHSIYSKKQDKWIWRDVLDPGILDDNGNTIDYPFLNGANYIYQRLNFNVLTEKNKTKKYELNTNDITNIDSLNASVDYIRNVTDDLFGNTNNDNLTDPYAKYTDEKC